MRKAAFVINPAHVHHFEALKHHCQETAADNGWDPELVMTGGASGLTDVYDYLSRYTSGGGDRLVFAVGGDGTVRACVNALVCTGAVLAIVPRGTANLFARALRVPRQLRAALEVGFRGERLAVDLALTDGDAFVAMAGMGLDAAVVRSTPRVLKDHLGWVSYAVGALAHLGSRPHEFTLRLDGGEAITRQAHSVVIGNVGILPGGFSSLPGALVDDGWLDVGVLAPEGWFGWGHIARRVLVGGHHADRQFEHFKARRVEVSAITELQRELDGDLIAPGRSLTATIQPKALLVMAPGHGSEAVGP
jgi:YegS/Rv2252/BmrU family lipid kinase